MITSRLRARTSAAVLAFGAAGLLLAGCGGGQPSPSTSTTPTTTTSSPTPAPSSTVAPSEKSIDPSGGNLFTPPVQAPPAPTVEPGTHHGLNGVP